MSASTIAPAKTMLTCTHNIQAPIAQVYESFTNRDNASDWLCFDADIRPEVGGYALFMWRDGRHAYGVFSELEENKRLAFSWQDGSDETGITQVEIDLEVHEDITKLTLVHSGFTDETTAESWRKEWEDRLDNLKSILETGANLFFTRRVIIGILAGPFDSTIAERLGVPVTEGVRVDGLVPGFSAEAAGLQKDDVIVEVGDTAIGSTDTIASAVQGKEPGDEVQVAYYRNGERHSITATLKGYPIPEIPPDITALADKFEAHFAAVDAELTAVLDGVSEEAAMHKASENELNAKEIIAQVILGARQVRNWLGSYLQGPRRDSNYRRVPGRVAAVVSVYPTVSELLDELRRTWAESVAIVRAFPPELEERKNNLWWITFESGGFNLDIDCVYIAQIRKALEVIDPNVDC